MTNNDSIPKRRGLAISWPMAAAFMAIWIVAVVGFAHQANRNVELGRQLQQQDERIADQAERIAYLEDRLRVLEAVEDLQTNLSHDDEARLAADIYEVSQEHQLPPLLIVAVIKVESSFGTDAVSIMGARGLMQVKPSTGRWVASQVGWEWPSDDALFEPDFNLRVGTRYLADLCRQFGCVENALVAYNRGETVVRESLQKGRSLPYSYTRRVMDAFNDLRLRYGAPRIPLTAPCL